MANQQYEFYEKIMALLNDKIDYAHFQFSTVTKYLDGLENEVAEKGITLTEYTSDFLPMRSDTD